MQNETNSGGPHGREQKRSEKTMRTAGQKGGPADGKRGDLLDDHKKGNCSQLIDKNNQVSKAEGKKNKAGGVQKARLTQRKKKKKSTWGEGGTFAWKQRVAKKRALGGGGEYHQHPY